MPSAASHTIALPRIVDLDAIEPLREALLEALPLGPVTITGDDVERVATNALFLLLSAAQSARSGGHALALGATSPALDVAIAQLGLTPAFSSHFQRVA